MIVMFEENFLLFCSQLQLKNEKKKKHLINNNLKFHKIKNIQHSLLLSFKY